MSEALDPSTLAPPPKASPYAAGEKAIAYADGACRGNPGPASYGCVYAKADGTVLCGEGAFLGSTTNNVAEYRGCIAALQRLADWGVSSVELRLDSQLVVRQIEGRYKVRQAHLKPLHAQALALRARFASFAVVHVPRAENALADALANAALDGAG